MAERISCVVPFCRRTMKRTAKHHDLSEWMCGRHWRLIPKIKRQVYGRIMRQWRRFRRAGDVARADRIWFRLKREAIERAGGIG
jgi:hypothetical protein